MLFDKHPEGTQPEQANPASELGSLEVPEERDLLGDEERMSAPELSEETLAILTAKTQSRMLMEMYTSWFGVPGTEDKGAIEKIKLTETHLAILNGSVRTNTAWRKVHTWVIGIIVSLSIALFVLIATVVV